jgi:hypothetical protein
MTSTFEVSQILFHIGASCPGIGCGKVFGYECVSYRQGSLKFR